MEIDSSDEGVDEIPGPKESQTCSQPTTQTTDTNSDPDDVDGQRYTSDVKDTQGKNLLRLEWLEYLATRDQEGESASREESKK